jgi:hypothetical protein
MRVGQPLRWLTLERGAGYMPRNRAANGMGDYLARFAGSKVVGNLELRAFRTRPAITDI